MARAFLPGSTAPSRYEHVHLLLLTRGKVFDVAESRPAFLSEKGNDTHIKTVMKKFPTLDIPRVSFAFYAFRFPSGIAPPISFQSQATPFFLKREELHDTFEEPYQNLVDILEFKVYHLAIPKLTHRTPSPMSSQPLALTCSPLTLYDAPPSS
jgi:hypothetical protein